MDEMLQPRLHRRFLRQKNGLRAEEIESLTPAPVLFPARQVAAAGGAAQERSYPLAQAGFGDEQGRFEFPADVVQHSSCQSRNENRVVAETSERAEEVALRRETQ